MINVYFFRRLAQIYYFPNDLLAPSLSLLSQLYCPFINFGCKNVKKNGGVRRLIVWWDYFNNLITIHLQQTFGNDNKCFGQGCTTLLYIGSECKIERHSRTSHNLSRSEHD